MISNRPLETVMHAEPSRSEIYVSTRRKAIAFVDCCGYSAYTTRHGDRAAVEVLQELRHHLEREAHATDVVVVKWLGDGAMLAAESSLAILSCLYRTMIATRRSDLLPIRAGLAFGLVESVEDDGIDYLGASVNRAARLCAAAAPWQVRADAGAGRQMMHFTLRPLAHDSQASGATTSAKRGTPGVHSSANSGGTDDGAPGSTGSRRGGLAIDEAFLTERG